MTSIDFPRRLRTYHFTLTLTCNRPWIMRKLLPRPLPCRTIIKAARPVGLCVANRIAIVSSLPSGTTLRRIQLIPYVVYHSSFPSYLILFHIPHIRHYRLQKDSQWKTRSIICAENSARPGTKGKVSKLNCNVKSATWSTCMNSWTLLG